MSTQPIDDSHIITVELPSAEAGQRLLHAFRDGSLAKALAETGVDIEVLDVRPSAHQPNVAEGSETDRAPA